MNMNEAIDQIFTAKKEIRDRYEKIEHLINEIEKMNADQKVLKILVDTIVIENEERSRAYSQLQKE